MRNENHLECFVLHGFHIVSFARRVFSQHDVSCTKASVYALAGSKFRFPFQGISRITADEAGKGGELYICKYAAKGGKVDFGGPLNLVADRLPDL